MGNPPVDQLAYELPEIWDDDWFPAEDRERVRRLAILIPEDTKTLLDVGCGNGLFLNHLKREYACRFSKLVGVDRSEAAIKHVETEKRLASMDQLPFGNSQFDTVTCLEVLEHLPVTMYARALAEIARVAKRSIIVCVPYKQDLKASLCECPSCLARFNPDFHVRSYDEDTLRTLFLDHSFETSTITYLGKQVMRYDREVRARVWGMFHESAAGLPSYAICPVCGFCDKERLTEDLANRKREKLRAEAAVNEKRKPTGLRGLIASWLPRYSNYRWIAVTYTRS